jgi:peptide/nickel transport system substrate-binding protein
MKKWSVLMTVVIALALLLACGPAAPEKPLPSPEPVPAEPTPVTEPAPEPEVSPGVSLTPNPVETSLPVYGGTLVYATHIPSNFDGHRKAGYGPSSTLPVFNQLVIYNIDYKETVPENIIGDLAESWEVSEDGKTITFKLHQGVKWHDGIPFTAEDVVYSLDKMTDVNRSVIADMFPAYQSSEMIDDYTVKVHLKYPSAGFMIALAEGEAVIQAKHLAGTDPQTAEFMIGTGPFVLEDYLLRIHLKYKRNPDYWKKDQYGNQLPYMDGLIIYWADNKVVNEMLVGRRIDLRSPTAGASTVSTYEYLTEGAPELLWQKMDLSDCSVIYLNTEHPPLDDVRVRRAMGLLIDEESLIIGFSGDARFGIIDIGLLSPSLGLPKEEVVKLMGWDRPIEDRAPEAQRLMAEAGYPDGFKLNILTLGAPTMTQGAVSLVFADTLRRYLKIDAEVNIGLGLTEIYKRVDDNNYDLFTEVLKVGRDPVHLARSVGTGGYANYSNYSDPEVDRMLAELDHIVDPVERREVVWAIERQLLTDLPILPTGTFIGNMMPYYPHVKNLRWINMRYSNTVRLEDVWIDESLRVK